MDILRKELNALYKRQGLDTERLPEEAVGECIERVQTLSDITHCQAVITDIANDQSWLFKPQTAVEHYGSSDEDAIYRRMHPADLVYKRMLEYQFFQFIEQHPETATSYKALCHIRLRDANGKWVYVDNSTQVLRTSPEGKMWLILCCYSLSPARHGVFDIGAHIVCADTQEVTPCLFSAEKEHLLSAREKEILRLIQAGKQSKEIAEVLHISIFTVSRHRQNILQKLSVNNSMEAVNAAVAMGLV